MKEVMILVFSLSLIIACSKEEEVIEPTPSLQQNFTPMAVGNYWLYQHYHIDTMGNESLLSRIDTVTITRQEIIGSKAYYVFEGTYYFTSQGQSSVLWKLRDSSGYIVDTTGMVQFAQKDFSDSLEVFCLTDRNIDTIYCSAHQMQKELHLVTVPAGTFKALNYNRLITLYGSWVRPEVPNPREWDVFYANGVGRVQETFFYARQADHFEMRLLKYYVQ